MLSQPKIDTTVDDMMEVDMSLDNMIQELQRKNVQPPKYENDVKERMSELFFGFGKFHEDKKTYCSETIQNYAYIPMWMLSLLGLTYTDNDESRAYRKNS